MFRLWVAALTAFLSAATFTGPASAAKNDNSVRFAVGDVLENVDPYFNNSRVGVILGQHIWDTLIYRNPVTNLHEGLLATAWRWTDEKTLEIELRPNVKFHNGAAFVAEDVVYTLNFISKPENKVVNQQYVSWIDHAEKIDDSKVRITAKRPTPVALEYLAEYIPIYPHEYYQKFGPKGMNENPIGSGPFRVAEHAQGRSIRLVRNPEYFVNTLKAVPKIEKLEVRFIPDRQTQVAELLSGGIDLVFNVPVDQAQQLRAVPSVQVQFGETQRIAFLHLNTTEQNNSPPLRDLRVRKAVLHAIDRPKIVSSLVGEGSRVIHTICFPSQFGCTDEGVLRYDYNPDIAKKLLAEAGYSDGFDVDIYAYRERDQTEAIINYLRAVGIHANLRFMQFAAVRDQVRAGKAAIAHETWGTLVNDVSATTSVFFRFNPDDVNRDEEIRDLLEHADSTMDPTIRKEMYANALGLIQARAYVLPLFSLPIYYVAAKDLVFVVPSDEKPKFWEMRWR
jgi:peptide/nickel transport system substrate-binding protein